MLDLPRVRCCTIPEIASMTPRPLLLATLITALASGCSDAPVAPPPTGVPDTAALASERSFEPVVLTGDSVPSLVGVPPAQIAAFRYTAGAWTQIPVQVDERAVIALGSAYRGIDPTRCTQPTWCENVVGAVVQLYYTDSGTFVGADPDPAFDRNDELVFMARDAGTEAAANTAAPSSVQPGTGVKVMISEPGGGGSGFVYLYRQNGTLAPGAGQSYVNYNFVLASGGNYLTSYDRVGTSPDDNRRTGDALGANPENSTVTTPYYSQHFSDRWIMDALRITAGSASGADILDRAKVAFAPGSCLRTEYTGSRSEGAFIVNRSGPVRAIRAYLGFNSGPLVQRQHIFYDRYAEVTTSLRVHPIPGILDYMDYSAAAAGMTYRNNQNPGGVVVDGRPDNVRAGPLDWESLQGAPGTLVTAYTLASNTPALSRTSFYDDAVTSQYAQCTGDNSAYGASGTWITSLISNTDPRLGTAATLITRRQTVFGAPDLATGRMDAIVANLRKPLAIRVAVVP